MTTYSSIAGTEIDADSPLTTTLMAKLRDNPIAITEGASGAPRIAFEALGSWYVTDGGIGTYTFAQGAADASRGSTVAGSSLNPTSAMYRNDATTSYDAWALTSGAALSGTWKCMGHYDLSVTANGLGVQVYGATLWLRIA